jgi:hypothetical protein
MTDTRSFRSLMGRLDKAGFHKRFVSTALLPDWWSVECARDESVLPEIEVGIARFLGVPLDLVQDPSRVLKPKAFHGAQLRVTAKRKRTDVYAAMHAAVAVAGAVVRNLRVSTPAVAPPDDPQEWRAALIDRAGTVGLRELVSDLWSRGIPVVHLDVLPTPKFQGMACIVQGRPVVLLAWGDDAPACQLFHIAHECGHLARGHVAEDRPVIDQEIAGGKRTATKREREANDYAFPLLRGAWEPGEARRSTAARTATTARVAAAAGNVDPGHVILSWAWDHGHYASARAALKREGLATGARAVLTEHFERFVNVDDASESDRALLSCTSAVSGADASAAR